MNRKDLGRVLGVGLVALLCVPSTVWAQVPPTLGVAGQFGALGATGVTGSTGAGTVVNGDVGSFPTPAITNFNPPSTTVPPFIVHLAADGVVQQAQTDAGTAYGFLQGQGGATLPAPPAPDQLSGRTLGPGVYSLGAGDLAASTTLTLNGAGVFIFNVASTLTMNVSSAVIGTANPCNVFWRVGVSATLNGDSFIGTVIANTSITLGGGSVAGRLLALNGAVTMASGGNTIGGCSSAPPACPTITIAPAAPILPVGTVGVPYSQQLTASGGTGSYTFSVAAGALPAGLTLTPGGLLSGTPTTQGSSTVTIRATDGSGCPGTIVYVLVIGPAGCPVITIAPPTLPGGTVGVAYSQRITASGGAGSYVFAVASGSLPAGVTLTAAGLIAGTPIAPGSSTVVIRATDGSGCPALITYTIPVSAAACPTTGTQPTITSIPNQVIPVNGSVALNFTISGGVIPSALLVSATSSNQTLVGQGAIVIAGSGSARVLTINGADGRSGVTTITVTVTDPSTNCITSTSFDIAIGAAAVPTLPQWALLVLTALLALAGFVAVRRRTT